MRIISIHNTQYIIWLMTEAKEEYLSSKKGNIMMWSIRSGMECYRYPTAKGRAVASGGKAGSSWGLR